MSLFTQTLKKGGGQQEMQKEKEIHSLQEQLAALKEITVGGAVINCNHMISCNAFKLYLWLRTDLEDFFYFLDVQKLSSDVQLITPVHYKSSLKQSVLFCFLITVHTSLSACKGKRHWKHQGTNGQKGSSQNRERLPKIWQRKYVYIFKEKQKNAPQFLQALKILFSRVTHSMMWLVINHFCPHSFSPKHFTFSK